MTEVPDIEIVQYHEDLAKALADMYNSWDELWPTSYTQGVPYTAERVKKQFGSMSAIAILIALDTQTKKPLGSCTLHTHIRDADAAYVGTLGVSPEALNKRVGKRLLLKSIEIAHKNGYTRVDLNTWAGNTRAVPLYKKVGMMWNPAGEGLRMEDYIPSILDHPLCKPFFQGLTEPDGWYDLFHRELTQAPDDYTRDGMQVYPYEFRRGPDMLSVIVDRHSRAITSVDRIIGGKKLRASAKVIKHETLVGLPSKHIVELDNTSSAKLTVAIALEGFEGLHFETESKTKLVVEPNAKKRWEVPFRLDFHAPLHRKDRRTPAIVTHLLIDNVKAQLKTGLIIKPTADVRNEWSECRLGPGGKSTLPLTVFNSADQPMKGRLFIESPGVPLQVEPKELDIRLPASGRAGALLDVTADKNLEHGTYDLWAYLTLEFKASDGTPTRVTTRRFRLPVFCLSDGRVAVGENDRMNQVIVASRHYIARISREGGILRIGEADESLGGEMMMSSELGPPFGLTPLRGAERKSRVEEGTNATAVTMSVTHPERPLVLEDRYVFEANSGVIAHEMWVTNTGVNKEAFQVRALGRPGGIAFAQGNTYLPLAGGITRDSTGDIVFGYPVIPGNPSAFKEGWMAVQSPSGARGQFWDLELAEEVRTHPYQLNALLFPASIIAPGETRKVAQVWSVVGLGSWRDVRRMWLARVKGIIQGPQEDGKPLDVFSPVQVTVPPIVTPSLREVKADIRITRQVAAPMTGQLLVNPPEGWTADQSSIENYEVKEESAVSVKMAPTGNAITDRTIHRGSLSFITNVEQSIPLRIIQLGSEAQEVAVKEMEDQGAKVFRVNNGVCEFVVSPDFGGCMISLKNKNGTEFLTSSFPKPTPKEGGFMENYYGGIQPLIWGDEIGEDLSQSPTNKESMTGSTVSLGPWRGVEVSWVGKIQKMNRGMEVVVQYMTASGSPLILLRMLLRNKTTSPMVIGPSFLIDSVFNGTTERTMLRTEWNGELTNIHVGPMPFAAFPETKKIWFRSEALRDEGLGIVVGKDSTTVLGLSIPGSIMLGTADIILVNPNDERSVSCCLLVNPKSDEDLTDIREALPYLLDSAKS